MPPREGPGWYLFVDDWGNGLGPFDGHSSISDVNVICLRGASVCKLLQVISEVERELIFNSIYNTKETRQWIVFLSFFVVCGLMQHTVVCKCTIKGGFVFLEGGCRRRVTMPQCLDNTMNWFKKVRSWEEGGLWSWVDYTKPISIVTLENVGGFLFIKLNNANYLPGWHMN